MRMCRCLSRLAPLTFLTALTVGCASLGAGEVQERYVACAYDTVWDAAADTLKQFPLETQDKETGMIETAWVERPVHGRPYGMFQREGLGDKERFQTTMTLSRREEVTVVRLSERREHFGFRGGARIYQWYPVEPSGPAMRALMGRLTTRLEEHGCFVGT